MNKNEYRRAFIMLRAAAPGYAGHVRLERRTMMGGMYFVVTAPGNDSLRAALVGRRAGDYYAASAGTLRRDRRGQATAAWNFDPRNIDGRPLEAYPWVAIARSEDGEVVLTGNVDGAHDMNLNALRDAVRGLIAPETAPAADLPAPDELPATEPAPPAQGEIPEAQGVEAVPEPSPGTSGEQVSAPVPEGDPPAAGAACPVPPREGEPADAPSTETTPAGPDAAPQPARPRGARARIFTAMRAQPEQRPEVLKDDETDAPAQTAADRLGMDITAAWPEALEPLRRLFATQAPVDAPWEDGYVYVRAPMAGSDAHCLVGILASDGAAERVRYAVPGRYAPEPPAGLEGYAWSGGGGDGHWTLTLDAEGAPAAE